MNKVIIEPHWNLEFLKDVFEGLTDEVIIEPHWNLEQEYSRVHLYTELYLNRNIVEFRDITTDGKAGNNRILIET